MIKGVLLDLSGVLYTGDEVLQGALTSIERLDNESIPVRYLTNTTRSSRSAILKKLSRMGFDIDEGDLFTAPVATYNYLSANNLSPFLLVHPDLKPDFSGLIRDRNDAVVVGDAADGFTYGHMNTAFRLLMEGAPLLAMGNNRYFREADGLSLDIGPYVTALEYAADTKAIILGKPAPGFFHAAVDSIGCSPGQTVMVGDDVKSDVIGALEAGLHGILVRTGKYRQGDEDLLEGEGICLENISAVTDWILEKYG